MSVIKESLACLIAPALHDYHLVPIVLSDSTIIDSAECNTKPMFNKFLKGRLLMFLIVSHKNIVIFSHKSFFIV